MKSETTSRQDDAWDKSVLAMPPMVCGRLDIQTWDGTGEHQQKFVYVDGAERTLVQGPYCDEIAYASQRYRPMHDEIQSLRTKNAELRAVVERLPVTADGVRLVIGDFVFSWEPLSSRVVPRYPVGKGGTYSKCLAEIRATAQRRDPSYREVSECYSTREAALTARTAEQEGGG